MSGYYNQGPPPGGYDPRGMGGYPPQQGYGGPPYQQQGGYGPPQGPPPGQYGQHGGPPPPHQQHGQQWGPPPGPPPQQHSQQWGAPPGAPPQHQHQHQQPHQQHAQGPAAPPSPGYDLNMQAQGNALPDAQGLRKAMKGFGTDEKALIAILTKPDPMQMNLLRTTFNQHHRRDLEADIKSETSSYFCEGLIALVRGPLVQDCHNVRDAIKGLGTKESLLNDVLLGRSNADMRAIKTTYQRLFSKTMESDVSGDLSMKTEQLFKMVMTATRAEESAPLYPQQIDHDVQELHRAMAGMGTDQLTVCSILSSRSDGQIRAINQAFQQKYQGDLEKKIKSSFSGHMEEALVLMLNRACDRAMSDAVQLEETMAGMGTKDSLLVQRVVRVHWTKWSGHMDQAKRAYQHRYKKDLISRIKSETSGDYERLMVACVQ